MVDTPRLLVLAGWSGQLAAGLAVTLALAALSILCGTGLGLAAALASDRPTTFAGRLLAAVEAILRSLPELLVIFAVYYGFAFALHALVAPFGITGFVGIDAFWAGVMALASIHAAFCADVFRGAFAAVPPGPVEAARSLGLRPRQVFRLVTLPLAIRYGLPGWINLAIVSLKLTPLVAAIGLEDLLRTAGDAGRNTHDYLLFYLVALAVYLALAAGAGALQQFCERRIDRPWSA